MRSEERKGYRILPTMFEISKARQSRRTRNRQ